MYLDPPRKNVRTYGDVITKFFRVYGFPYSHGNGAPSGALCASGGFATKKTVLSIVLEGEERQR